LGSTEPNPYTLGRQGKEHQHLQFGSGTFRPILAGQVAYDAGPVVISTSGFGLLNLYNNRYGFRWGTEYSGDIAIDVPLLDGTLTPRASLQFLYWGSPLWDGQIEAEPVFSRTILLAGIGGRYTIDDRWWMAANLGIKITEFSEGPSLKTAGQLAVNLGRTFDLSADAKD
jgi:hypothetical protein